MGAKFSLWFGKKQQQQQQHVPLVPSNDDDDDEVDKANRHMVDAQKRVIERAMRTLDQTYDYYGERMEKEMQHASVANHVGDAARTLFHLKAAEGYKTIRAKIMTLMTLFNALKNELEQLGITTSVARVLQRHSDTMAQQLAVLHKEINIQKVLNRLETSVGELRNTDVIISAVNKSIEAAAASSSLGTNEKNDLEVLLKQHPLPPLVEAPPSVVDRVKAIIFSPPPQGSEKETLLLTK